MKTTVTPKLVCFVLALRMLFPASGYAANTLPTDSSTNWIMPWIRDADTDFSALEAEYRDHTMPLYQRLAELNQALKDPCTRNAETGFSLLWERMQLQDALKLEEDEHDLKKIKLRYRKGVEIVKMLYEKILSMDHHFSSLKAQQEMQKISNPHNYPEFKDARAIIEDKMKKKFNFTAPALFQANPYLSAAFSIVGLVVGGMEDKDKKADVEKIACIMDFTVRIHNDMNVIFYETGYLRDANMTLKRDCEALFSECARQVGYTIPLENCRNSDDWERLYALLDQLVGKSIGEVSAAGNAATPPDPRLQSRTQTNLQFAIDRILQFTNRYSDFVNQGNEYYKKFSKITGDYENEKSCSEILPDQFKQIKADIDQTLDKFNSAYRMPEVQGSKLKDMLYGGSEN